MAMADKPPFEALQGHFQMKLQSQYLRAVQEALVCTYGRVRQGG